MPFRVVTIALGPSLPPELIVDTVMERMHSQQPESHWSSYDCDFVALQVCVGVIPLSPPRVLGK